MTSYTTEPNQSIIDIATEKYGNIDAVTELVTLNDLGGKMDNPTYVLPGEVDFAYSIVSGTEIVHDTTSVLYNKTGVKALNGKHITTAIKSNYKVFSKIFAKQFH